MITFLTFNYDSSMTKEFIKIGLISISDRASSGFYEDLGLPTLENWLESVLITPFEIVARLIADEQRCV